MRGFTTNIMPLHDAVKKYKYRKFIPELIRRGANVNAIDCNGNTVLHLACIERCESDIIKCLVDGGAIVDAINYAGQTPLDIACDMRHYELLPTLLKAGAVANRVVDADGNTVLHKVFMSNNETITPLQDLLIRYGADLNIKNNFDKTPIDVALDKNNYLKLEWLLKSGRKFNVISNYYKMHKESSLRDIAANRSAATPLLNEVITQRLRVFGKYFAYKMANSHPPMSAELIRKQLHFLWGDNDQYYNGIIDAVITALETNCKLIPK